MSEYLLHILFMIAIYGTLAKSLDLLAGQAGLLSLSHAAFFGIGSYASALLTVRLGLPFLLAVLVGLLCAVVLSLLVSLPSARLYGDHFALATFAFQIVVFNLLNNWVEITRGPLGVSGIPSPTINGWLISSSALFVVCAATLLLIACVVVHRLGTSSFGRVLRAIREDEVCASALGKCTLRFKVTTFAVSSVLAASAGSLYAHYFTFIDPTAFTVMESILVLSMVIIGGTDSRFGPVLGAAVLVTLPEFLRFMGFPGPLAANLRQLTYGALLIIMMILRPNGLVGRYRFGR